MYWNTHFNTTGPLFLGFHRQKCVFWLFTVILKIDETASLMADKMADITLQSTSAIHASYRLPSLASHLSNHQIAAITNGEYVDLASLLPFSSLLRDRVNSNLKLQVGNEGLIIPLPSPPQRPKINCIDRWLDILFGSPFFLPFRGVDLFSYQQLIR